MNAMEIYTVTFVIAVTITQGLSQNLQNCSDHCKLSNRSISARGDCDCSSENPLQVRLIKQNIPNFSEENIAPVTNSYSKKFFFNPNTKRKSILYKTTKQNQRTSSQGQKRRQRKMSQNYEQNLHEMIRENEIPLYLDIDLSVKNKTFYEELGNNFENFQSIEKKISECLNLHIFLFSKNIDSVNKTNTNWGHDVKHYDKLSNSEILSEIRNICNQTNNIMKQNVYDIKKRWSKTIKTSGLSQPGNNFYETTEQSPETVATILQDNVLPIQKIYQELSEGPNTVTNKYNVETYSGNDTSASVIKTNKEIETMNEGSDFDPKTYNKTIFDENNLSKESNALYTPTLTDNTDDVETPFITKTDRTDNTIQKISGYENHDSLNELRSGRKYTTPLAVDPISENNLENMNSNITGRPEYKEGEYLIPKIISKELPNDKVTSVVAGYEEIPNSDFKNESTKTVYTENNTVNLDISTPGLQGLVIEQLPNQNSETQKLKTNLPANALEIKGELYFLYGKHHIPARFIQKQDGKIHLAIDGFSLCEQFLRQNKHQSAYMNLLCNCIVFDNCTKI